MIEFDYVKEHPDNFLEIEIQIKEKYKNIVERYPNESIKFTWINNEWSIWTSDVVLYQMNVQDNANKA